MVIISHASPHCLSPTPHRKTAKILVQAHVQLSGKIALLCFWFYYYQTIVIYTLTQSVAPHFQYNFMCYTAEKKYGILFSNSSTTTTTRLFRKHFEQIKPREREGAHSLHLLLYFVKIIMAHGGNGIFVNYNKSHHLQYIHLTCFNISSSSSIFCCCMGTVDCSIELNFIPKR